MDPRLIEQAVAYHGGVLLDKLIKEQYEIENLPHLMAYGHGKADQVIRSENLKDKVHSFIARKGKHLFQRQDGHSHDPPATKNDKPDEEMYAVMPPIESFMGIPASFCKSHFYQSAEPGDLVIGIITAVQDSGLTVTLICMEDNKFRDMDHLRISAFCPIREVPKLYAQKDPLDGFSIRDKVKGIITYVEAEDEKIYISLLERSLPKDKQHVKVGLISDEDIPVHYRRALSASGKEYSDVMEKLLEFNNPANIKFLCNKFKMADMSSPTLMSGLANLVIPDTEYAESLRKEQSYKCSMKSVIEGVKYFKEGKYIEAVQHINKALQIDSKNVEALVARGALFANNESYVKAIEDFEAALEINGKHRNALKYVIETSMVYAKSLHEQGRVDDAVRYYNKVLRYDPGSKEAIILRDRVKNRHFEMQGTTMEEWEEEDFPESSKQSQDSRYREISPDEHYEKRRHGDDDDFHNFDRRKSGETQKEAKEKVIDDFDQYEADIEAFHNSDAPTSDNHEPPDKRSHSRDKSKTFRRSRSRSLSRGRSRSRSRSRDRRYSRDGKTSRRDRSRSRDRTEYRKNRDRSDDRRRSKSRRDLRKSRSNSRERGRSKSQSQDKSYSKNQRRSSSSSRDRNLSRSGRDFKIDSHDTRGKYEIRDPVDPSRSLPYDRNTQEFMNTTQMFIEQLSRGKPELVQSKHQHPLDAIINESSQDSKRKSLEPKHNMRQTEDDSRISRDAKHAKKDSDSHVDRRKREGIESHEDREIKEDMDSHVIQLTHTYKKESEKLKPSSLKGQLKSSERESRDSFDRLESRERHVKDREPTRDGSHDESLKRGSSKRDNKDNIDQSQRDLYDKSASKYKRSKSPVEVKRSRSSDIAERKALLAEIDKALEKKRAARRTSSAKRSRSPKRSSRSPRSKRSKRSVSGGQTSETHQPSKTHQPPERHQVQETHVMPTAPVQQIPGLGFSAYPHAQQAHPQMQAYASQFYDVGFFDNYLQQTKFQNPAMVQQQTYAPLKTAAAPSNEVVPESNKTDESMSIISEEQSKSWKQRSPSGETPRRSRSHKDQSPRSQDSVERSGSKKKSRDQERESLESHSDGGNRKSVSKERKRATKDEYKYDDRKKYEEKSNYSKDRKSSKYSDDEDEYEKKYEEKSKYKKDKKSSKYSDSEGDDYEKKHKDKKSSKYSDDDDCDKNKSDGKKKRYDSISKSEKQRSEKYETPDKYKYDKYSKSDKKSKYNRDEEDEEKYSKPAKKRSKHYTDEDDKDERYSKKYEKSAKKTESKKSERSKYSDSSDDDDDDYKKSRKYSDRKGKDKSTKRFEESSPKRSSKKYTFSSDEEYQRTSKKSDKYKLDYEKDIEKSTEKKKTKKDMYDPFDSDEPSYDIFSDDKKAKKQEDKRNIMTQDERRVIAKDERKVIAQEKNIQDERKIIQDERKIIVSEQSKEQRVIMIPTSVQKKKILQNRFGGKIVLKSETLQKKESTDVQKPVGVATRIPPHDKRSLRSRSKSPEVTRRIISGDKQRSKSGDRGRQSRSRSKSRDRHRSGDRSRQSRSKSSDRRRSSERRIIKSSPRSSSARSDQRSGSRDRRSLGEKSTKYTFPIEKRSRKSSDYDPPVIKVAKVSEKEIYGKWNDSDSDSESSRKKRKSRFDSTGIPKRTIANEPPKRLSPQKETILNEMESFLKSLKEVKKGKQEKKTN
ncbi:unnamed protein product [Owenia fusiformis]|uniref:S1 motif domain-containing protein n=1 Tax=Owenia fusiformis TaxID=6347 RepID=A0A8S4NL01_OWEFU|nr:unnamed protein product [Owenia fusiformis]